MPNRLNNALDHAVRPEVSLAGRRLPQFQIWCGAGLALGVCFAMGLAGSFGLSRLVMAGLIVGIVLSALVVAMITKIIMGEEWLIYYHYHLAAMILIPAALGLLHQPILPYLDLIFLGGGISVVVGRVGCLMVGCCHGRLHGWGVCYRPEHAAVGFPSYYVDVRVFPVQVMESLGVFLIVIAGGLLFLSKQRPGEAFAWYVVAYGMFRFGVEFFRGDSRRHHVIGFSESQWISFGLLCFVTSAEYAGLLTYHSWHLAAAVLLGITMVGVFVTRRRRAAIKYRLRNPEHQLRVAVALERLSQATTHRAGLPWQPVNAARIPVECTTLGMRISSSRVQSAQGSGYLYGLSFQDETMTQDDAAALAKLVMQLKHAGRSHELIAGHRGVFHLLVHPENSTAFDAEIQHTLSSNTGAPERRFSASRNPEATLGLSRF